MPQKQRQFSAVKAERFFTLASIFVTYADIAANKPRTHTVNVYWPTGKHSRKICDSEDALFLADYFLNKGLLISD